jgi:hypothetical protein
MLALRDRRNYAPLDGGASSAQQNAQQAQVLNMAARQAIVRSALPMTQPIFSGTFVPATQNIINIAPRYVGLIRRFIVELTATVNNSAGSGSAITPTVFSAANLLSQVVFTDLNNNVRVNTSGWHLFSLACARHRRVYGSAVTTDTPIGFGSNFTVIKQTASIAANANGTINMVYEVPLAYSDDDLRGAVWAQIVNATMNLQLTINPNVAIATASDSTLYMYKGTTPTSTITSCVVNVYQEYYDQLPQANGKPLLPMQDLATIYEIKNTTFTAIVANQDFPMQYANFRQFLSTYAVFDNAGVLNTGSDVAYWSIQSANFTNIIKFDATISALKTRQIIGDDAPAGTYYFDHRKKPISTIQYGNMQLILNASAVTAGASILVGYEAFALVNQLSGAGSLAAS